MAAAEVTPASTEATPEQKWETFLQACDRLIDSENEWPPEDGVLGTLKCKKKEERKHITTLTLDISDVVILAGLHPDYAAKTEGQRMAAVMKGRQPLTKAESERKKKDQQKARTWLRSQSTMAPRQTSAEETFLSKTTRGVRVYVEKDGILKDEGNQILVVNKTIICNNSTAPVQGIPSCHTNFSFLQGTMCHKDHVAEISLGASILSEYHPNWRTFAQLHYYNTDTQEGRTVTWEVDEAAALISNMRQCAEGQLQRLRGAGYFLQRNASAWKKIEEKKRRKKKREARAQQQPEQPRKRKKKVKMSHFDEEKQNCDDGMQIKQLSYTRPGLLSSSIRSGHISVIREAFRGNRNSWKRKKKKNRRRPKTMKRKKIVKQLFTTHVSYLNDIYKFSLPFVREHLLRRLESNEPLRGSANLPWHQSFYTKILSFFSSCSAADCSEQEWDAFGLCQSFENRVQPPANIHHNILSPSAVAQMVSLLGTRLAADFERGLVQNAPRLLKKLLDIEAPEDVTISIRRQILIDGLQSACESCGLLQSKFNIDGIDETEESLSATLLETLLRSSVAAGKYLEEAGHHVAAIIPSASVKTEASFMTIDTTALCAMLGSAIPSVKANGMSVVEKREIWMQYFELPRIHEHEFFAYSIQSDGHSIRFLCHRHHHYDLAQKKWRTAMYQQFKKKAEALSNATKKLYEAEGDGVAAATAAVKDARAAYFRELDNGSSTLKTNLNNLRRGLPYTDFAKDVCDSPEGVTEEEMKQARKQAMVEFLATFAPGQKLKLLSNDPGVKSIFTALQLCSDAQDIRDTQITMSSKEYHFLCGTKVRGLLMAAERLNFLKLFDADERAKNGRSLFLENATAFRNLVLEHFDQIQLMNRSRRTKKLHARKFAAKQHAIAIAANRLTAHEKDETVVLLYGRGSEKDGFTGSKIRGNVFGPAKSLYEYIRRRRLAIVIWVSEHRTSQLSLEGVPVHHPWESRAKVISKRRHKCSRNLDRGDNGLHPLNTVGCFLLLLYERLREGAHAGNQM